MVDGRDLAPFPRPAMELSELTRVRRGVRSDGDVVRIEVDSSTWAVRFFLNGSLAATVANGAKPGWHFAACKYNDRARFVIIDQSAPPVAPVPAAMPVVGGAATRHVRFSSSLGRNAAQAVKDGGTVFDTNSDCVALCENPIKAGTGVHVFEVRGELIGSGNQCIGLSSPSGNFGGNGVILGFSTNQESIGWGNSPNKPGLRVNDKVQGDCGYKLK